MRGRQGQRCVKSLCQEQYVLKLFPQYSKYLPVSCGGGYIKHILSDTMCTKPDTINDCCCVVPDLLKENTSDEIRPVR